MVKYMVHNRYYVVVNVEETKMGRAAKVVVKVKPMYNADFQPVCGLVCGTKLCARARKEKKCPGENREDGYICRSNKIHNDGKTLVTHSIVGVDVVMRMWT